MPEGTCRLGMGRMLDHQPWVSHVEEHMQDLLELWRRRTIRRFYMLLWLPDGQGHILTEVNHHAHQVGALCAITGCACLF